VDNSIKIDIHSFFGYFRDQGYTYTMKYLQYFDKDFFKFMAAFLLIVLVSISMIVFTNDYHCRSLAAGQGMITDDNGGMC
jgi:hypothetical protein